MSGRLAENLRRLERYRQSSQVFIDPSPLLKQARINALHDGKILIMPGFGLKAGFYRLEPFRIPFSKLSLAVDGRDLPSFGHQMAARHEMADLKIDIMVGEYWAVDQRGYGVGEGKGFFDLAGALLAELGSLTNGYLTVVAIQDRARLVADLQEDAWDISGEVVLTPDEIVTIKEPNRGRKGIIWDVLTLDRVRRITPLWKLYVEQGRDR